MKENLIALAYLLIKAQIIKSYELDQYNLCMAYWLVEVI